MEAKDLWPLIVSIVALAASLWAVFSVEWNRPRADWRIRIDWHTEKRDLGMLMAVQYDAALINIGSAAATDIEVYPVVVSISGEKVLTGTTVRAGEHADLRINFPLSYNGGTGRQSYGPNFDSEGSQLIVTYRDTPRGKRLRKKVLHIPEYMNRPPRL